MACHTYCTHHKTRQKTKASKLSSARLLHSGRAKEALGVSKGKLFGNVTGELRQPVARLVHTVRQYLPATGHPRIGTDHKAVWETHKEGAPGRVKRPPRGNVAAQRELYPEV
jgi:hypothetical protein